MLNRKSERDGKTGLCEINEIDRNFNKFPTAGVTVVRKKKRTHMENILLQTSLNSKKKKMTTKKILEKSIYLQ